MKHRSTIHKTSGIFMNKNITIGLGLLFVIIVVIAANAFHKSLFFTKPNRLNIFVYDKDPVIYSLGFKDDLHYQIYFAPDLRLDIPGCFGKYRVGALGKLSHYQNNPAMIMHTGASAISAFIDHYFYVDNKDAIYYGSNTKRPVPPHINQILFASSDVRFLDRFYLAYYFIRKPAASFKPIEYGDIHSANPEKDFYENYQGIFFDNLLRYEKRSTQILYKKSYQTALSIQRILEGEGVRVVDVTKSDSIPAKCKIIEDFPSFSRTALRLSSYFGCTLEKGKTDIYDIIIELGNVEKEWEVCK